MWHASKAALAAALGLAALGTVAAPATVPTPAGACNKPVYLTFDTGHMGVAPLVAQVLSRQQVKATFFAANEPTLTGGTTLDDTWAPWWRARAQEGHVLASHTWDHDYWVADKPGNRFAIRPSAGPNKSQRLDWGAADYCASLQRASDRLREMTGQPAAPLFRAAGGKTSPALLAAAKACGYAHVGWAAAGFLGDELPSDRYPNAQLLKQALARIQPGDILMAHLGIRSRQDPWAPAVLEPLIVGLKARGLCFATLKDHPDYAWTR